MIIKNEELQAEFTLPDPFTGQNYVAYMQALNSTNVSALMQGIDGALAVITSGHYMEDGEQKSLTEKGQKAPLTILVWIQAEVSHYIAERLTLPKLSYEPVPKPQTEQEKRP